MVERKGRSGFITELCRSISWKYDFVDQRNGTCLFVRSFVRSFTCIYIGSVHVCPRAVWNGCQALRPNLSLAILWNFATVSSESWRLLLRQTLYSTVDLHFRYWICVSSSDGKNIILTSSSSIITRVNIHLKQTWTRRSLSISARTSKTYSYDDSKIILRNTVILLTQVLHGRDQLLFWRT